MDNVTRQRYGADFKAKVAGLPLPQPPLEQQQAELAQSRKLLGP